MIYNRGELGVVSKPVSASVGGAVGCFVLLLLSLLLLSLLSSLKARDMTGYEEDFNVFVLIIIISPSKASAMFPRQRELRGVMIFLANMIPDGGLK